MNIEEIYVKNYINIYKNEVKKKKNSNIKLQDSIIKFLNIYSNKSKIFI